VRYELPLVFNVNAKKQPGSGHGRLRYFFIVEEGSSRFGFKRTFALFKNMFVDFAEELVKRCYGKYLYILVSNHFNFCY
jgi:hypothetical protein